MSVSWKPLKRSLCDHRAWTRSLVVLALIAAATGSTTTDSQSTEPTSSGIPLTTHTGPSVTTENSSIPFTTHIGSSSLPTQATSSLPTTETPTSTNPPLLPSSRDPSDYRLTFHDPPRCKPSECDVFVGIDNNQYNDSYLDIYLEGKAEGWIAVGFSKTHNMFAADVVACNRNPKTDEVNSIDAWNSAVDRRATVDPNNDVVRFSSSYNNGSICCSVAKAIAPEDPDHDLNLDSLLYVLYGRRKGPSGENELFRHEIGPGEVPKITNELLNPLTLRASIDDSFPRPTLLRAHGIIMIIAWSLLASTGIFFASWMRPVLPKSQWLQVHRAFLLASLFMGAAGFVLPFAANYNRSPHGLLELGRGNPFGSSHFAVGTAVMLLHIINPIMAAFRCKPNTKRRWIFKVCHGVIAGKLAHLLALVNICLGGYVLFQRITPLLWVCVGFSAFILLFSCILLVFLKCVCRQSGQKDLELVSHRAMDNHQLLSFADDEEEEEEVEELTAYHGSLKESKKSEASNTSQQQRRPSKDTFLRWSSLVIYLVISLPLTVAMAALVALQH